MSLDGYVTGPDPNLDRGLGRGGERLHAWVFEEEAGAVDELRQTGAVVMGRRLFDFIDGPNGWKVDSGYAPTLKGFTPPVFVVTHRAPETARLAKQCTFVTEGLGPAIARARAAAGDKVVVVMGGADVVRQSIDQALVDEVRIHLAPILLGGGTSLFPGTRPRGLVQLAVRVSPQATHLTYGLSR